MSRPPITDLRTTAVDGAAERPAVVRLNANQNQVEVVDAAGGPKSQRTRRMNSRGPRAHWSGGVNSGEYSIAQ